MDDAELKGAIVALQNVVATRYVSGTHPQLLLYDHLLTLSDEIEYIWSAPNSVAKVLFLILRYLVPSFIAVQTTLRSGLSVIEMSDELNSCSSRPIICPTNSRCKSVMSIGSYAGWLSIVISNFLVLLRIWTTLPHSHRLRFWSIVLFIVAQLGSLGATTWAVAQMIPVLFFDARIGLCSFSSRPNVIGMWVVGLAYEVVVFLTVSWNTLNRPRALGIDPEVAVTRIFLRDGIVYFVILFGMHCSQFDNSTQHTLTTLRIANTVITVISPVSSLFIIVFFVWAGTTATTSRLIINSRRAAGKAAEWRQLNAPDHTNTVENPPDSTPDMMSYRSISPIARHVV
ncbi:hypothetical protein R3P38DRAFT_2575143 [Favolaschia claudopus]|uniref:DUF6533 domain-containing protein n=1 Tax=Favolaschia claudopus TaxID=2862362 RepID=A0AAV9ZLE7_9AGAR